MSKETTLLLKPWECKHCHQPVKDEDSVASHLIDGFLYGWCRPCFDKFTQQRTQQAEKRVAETNSYNS